jgi:alkyl hydroperoxide reductase subunit AhpF
MFRSIFTAVALASVLTVCQLHAQAEPDPYMELRQAAAQISAEPFNPALVYTVTMSQYVNAGGDSTVEMKGRLALYVKALEVELEELRKSAEAQMAKTPQLKEVFNKNHAAFLAFLETQARLSEEARWWNLQTGTRDDGTARGYEYMGTKGALLWKQMRAYGHFVSTGSLEVLPQSPMVNPDSEKEVGGHGFGC